MEESLNENLFFDMNKNLNAEDIAMLSPLQLAYIGDAVYELMIRTYILGLNDQVHELHKKATSYVKAEAQAEIVHGLEEELSEEEIRIFKRGRNAKSKTRSKNADMIDYRYSTGFEALIGYLYLNKKYDRLKSIVEKSIELIDGEEC